MGKPAAKEGDTIIAQDTHIVMVPAAGGGTIPTPIPGHPFNGIINGALSQDVRINGSYAATKGSTAENKPGHIPISGPSFQTPPSNNGKIVTGSTRVLINGLPAARADDKAITCDDMVPMAPKGTVVATPGSKPVLIGD